MRVLMTTLISTLLVSCIGGSYVDSPEFQARVAELRAENARIDSFVTSLNTSSDFAVTKVKKKNKDVFVVHDLVAGEYSAIDIEGYVEGTDAVEFYNQNSHSFYFDLDFIPGYTTYDTVDTSGYDANGNWVSSSETITNTIPDRYVHKPSNMVFEKVSQSPKDLAKVTAVKEALAVRANADFLSEELGLSLDRSMEIASLHKYWAKASKKAMTLKELNSFSSELLGFSMESAVSAATQAINGNESDLNQLVDIAAEKNSISPEHASKLMTKLFSL